MISLILHKQSWLRNLVGPLCLVGAVLGAASAEAGEVTLAWDAVSDRHVGGYQIYYGQSSHRYANRIDAGNQTRVRIQGLEEGAQYFFSVTAYSQDRGAESQYSNEISTVVTAPLSADFAAHETRGAAPLLVHFTDTSRGTIHHWHWDFGDGTTSSAPVALKSYAKPGTYTVTLTVSGPKGTQATTKANLVTVLDPAADALLAAADGAAEAAAAEAQDATPAAAEVFAAGAVEVSTQWTAVHFGRTFNDPVVVGSLGADPPRPAVLQIRQVHASGFEARIEPAAEPAGAAAETLHYLVMERGRHTLEDGTQVEAGAVVAQSADALEPVAFRQGFAVEPIVVTAVTSANGADAVLPRVQHIDRDGFELGLQNAQAEPAAPPAAETIAYIAFEPALGNLPGRDFEAGLAAAEIDPIPYRIAYQQAFATAPIVLVALQSSEPEEPAQVRWSANEAAGVDVQVRTESASGDTPPARAVVGYLAFSR